MLKRIVCMLFTLVILSVVLASCHGTSAIDKYLVVAIVIPDQRDTWDEVIEGAARAIKQYTGKHAGMQVQLKLYKCDYPRDIDDRFEDALTEEVDGICIAMPTCLYEYAGDPSEPSVTTEYDSDLEAIYSISEMINKATDDGIPVITIGNDQYLCSGDPGSPHYWSQNMAAPSRLCFVGSDNTIFGRRLAEKAMELQNSSAKLFVLRGWLKNTEQWYRYQGMKEVLEDECFIDGTSVERHQFPYENHGVFWSGEVISHSADPNNIGKSYLERGCMCESALEYGITKLHEDFNTVISTWVGGNAAANVFRGLGWDDADTNLEHVLILSEYSIDTITAIKERFATCALIEDRESWGEEGVKILLATLESGEKPESEFFETESYWIDYLAVYDWSTD